MVSPEKSVGQGVRTLRDWLKTSSSRPFKMFSVRWKWRRTRMYKIMTIVIIFLFFSVVSPTFSSVLNNFNGDQHGGEDQLRIQTILKNLTSAETQAIFGISDIPKEFVPTLDIVKPTVAYEKKRRKRFAIPSLLSKESESTEKVIQLRGLGRSFALTLHQNPSILNLNEFVHLFRRDNYTEILSDDIVRRQLACFHQGTVSHRSISESDTLVTKARTALDTCDNSLKGLIVPVDKNEEHYVIHPLPKRFRNPATGTRLLPEHFIWKRQSPHAHTSANNRYVPRPQSFCGHDDITDAHEQPRSPSVARAKRSQMSFDDDLSDEHLPYRYKPQNVAVDSYWLRHRSTLRPPDDYRHHRYVQPGHFPSADYWTPSQGLAHEPYRDMSTTRDGDLARSATSSRASFPFYTSTAQASVSESQYYYNTSQTRSGHFHRSKANDDRQARGDNTIFGEAYHSSLDSDLMSTAQSRVFKEMEPAHLTIETAVFVDKDLYEHMQANFPDDTQAEVSRIVLAMINAVQLLYQDPSLGHRVEFVLKRLEVLATDPPGLVRPYDIDGFLTNFCKWQKTENPASDADPLHWDHALILTGLDLYVVHQSKKISNQVVGLAPVAGMCTKYSSCTVNEGRHFESVYVMAHEIGHNLGMRHDGPQADNECDPTAHIMSPTLGSGKITWSPCSKRYLDMFLETSQSKCLLDKSKSETRLDHDADRRLPGERFNADQQCVLKYGRGSFHATQQPMEDVCRDLHCRKQYYTWTSHPALEGTECGLEMSCRAGKCVSRSQLQDVAPTQTISGLINHSGHSSNHLGQMDGSETAAYSTLKALHGVWGTWSPFTDCSSACLDTDENGVSESSTGIRLAARRCDSPRPENGGRQCSGLDRRYKTCNTDKVCPSSLPRSSTSQYANEVCTRAAAVDTELTGRGFMTTGTNDPERACSVWCEIAQGMGSRSRGWSFPDGTACKLSSRPYGSHFCVAGKCQEFTCDSSSHFALSDDICTLHTKPSSDQAWFGNRLSENTFRQEKSVWTKWESQSTCKLTCLVPSKGLQMVQRKCHVDENKSTACSGLALSVRLCKPDKTTILSNACARFQTAFEHATKLCKKYSEKVAGLSGVGMQLSPTKDDSHRPCRIGCQDASLPYRFYMVNGEEGWFPAGTDCSRGDTSKKAYCLSGKCIDFGLDDTPMYRINPKVLGRLESVLRTKRQTSEPFSSVTGTMDQASTEGLIQKFASNGIRTEGIVKQNEFPVDFERPTIHAGIDQNPRAVLGNLGKNPGFENIEGSFYEWRKILMDCSTSCGNGVQQVIVQCTSGGTVVADQFCEGQLKPGKSSYVHCNVRVCTESELNTKSVTGFAWATLQWTRVPHRNHVT